jgi:bacterioferritin-associated ferredoxin
MVQAITALDLQTLMDVRRQTGAGEGCTCCHEQIRQFLEQLHCAPAKCA